MFMYAMIQRTLCCPALPVNIFIMMDFMFGIGWLEKQKIEGGDEVADDAEAADDDDGKIWGFMEQYARALGMHWNRL